MFSYSSVSKSSDDAHSGRVASEPLRPWSSARTRERVQSPRREPSVVRRSFASRPRPSSHLRQLKTRSAESSAFLEENFSCRYTSAISFDRSSSASSKAWPESVPVIWENHQPETAATPTNANNTDPGLTCQPSRNPSPAASPHLEQPGRGCRIGVGDDGSVDSCFAQCAIGERTNSERLLQFCSHNVPRGFSTRIQVPACDP